jgi:hypothetical protein
MRAAFAIAAAVDAAALLTLAEPAQAQANRTFVSGHGSDTNPCSLTAPCRSFAQALTQTNAGGEITILDPAGYGSVTIGKSVSIVNDGIGEAGVTVTSHTDAIDISIGASDVVNLRGLTLVGGGVGFDGIAFTNLGTLNIQNCVIRGFTNDGIDLGPGGTAQFNISETIVSNAVNFGVQLSPTGSGAVTAVFNRVQTIGNGVGFIMDGAFSTGGAINATIANSTATNSVFYGIAADTEGGGVTRLMVSNSVASNNGTGVFAGFGALVYLAKNTIAGNTTAFTVADATLSSFGDNYIKANGDDGGAIPLVSTK